MRKLKIAYASQSPDLKHPVDRRRLVYWAERRGHEVRTDLDSKSDVIVLSSRADITFWTQKSNRPPVILDLVDGYLGAESTWKDWVRGFGKVATKNISGPIRPYREIVSQACELSNAVICETQEQKETILPYCKNTHSILDFHEEFPFLQFDEENSIRKNGALMWEGLPFTAKGLLLLEKAFREISASQEISLEVVTDLRYPRFLGKYIESDTRNIFGQIPHILGENFTLTKWNLIEVVNCAQRSSLSVLPLDPNGPLNTLKAENRLLMMWRLGLPVLTSPSLAYSRVMNNLGIDGVCKSPAEWYKKIELMNSSVELRRESVEKGQQYIRDTHSEPKVLEAWDILFESVL